MQEANEESLIVISISGPPFGALSFFDSRFRGISRALSAFNEAIHEP
jgi:hypothetical protein